MSIFLPPTMLDYGGNDAFTKILLHMDGANAGTVFTDSNAGGSAHTWTATTATTDTGNAKFGSAGDNNNSGWVETPSSSDFNLGSGDWTIDFRLKMGPTDGTQYRLFGQCDSATTPTTISVGGSRVRSNVLSFTAEVGSTAFSVTGTTTFLNGGAYRHVAFVRSGSNLMLFVEGVQEGGTTTITGSINSSANKWAVGRLGETVGSNAPAWFDEFRLSVGIARWTANFTPPTEAYS